MSSYSKLEQEIGQLTDLPRSELVERWVKLYRCPPPKSIKRGLLERAIAWHFQARHFGGLSPSFKRQLREVANAFGGNDLAGPSKLACSTKSTGLDGSAASHRVPFVGSSSLPPGTRLIRDWHGKSHAVDVVEEGFVFEGRTYGSLSAIAREITGARWSGPRFFRL